MVERVFRDDVRRLQEEGAQVVEVLPRKEYEHQHIAGAISLPLEELTPQTAGVLDRDRPVVTYCFDFQCDLSPRAAARLEAMGFTRVLDYEGGKMDWVAFGLPTEGAAAREPTIGAAARRDAPTCRMDERLGDLRARMAEGWAWCAVVDGGRLVLGRVSRRQVDEQPDALVSDVMDPGPSTYRQGMPAEEMVAAMKKGSFERAFVTDSDGRLVGLVALRDLEAAVRPGGGGG
jgi:rhodanese-related sulfurtransferase/CBS domain-containing protein